MNIMTDFNKALYQRTGSQLDLSFDLTTLEGSDRVVVGFATLDNIDFGDDIVSAEASLKAFQDFRGNVRLQHDKTKPVGRVLDFTPATFYDEITGETHNGIKVAVYISKGAEDVWQMCLDGTLSGFSIGGAVKKASKAYKANVKKTIQVIDEYSLVELSIVDSPMNGLGNVLSVFKSFDNAVLQKSFDTQNLFYCGFDTLGLGSHSDELSCPECDEAMVCMGSINENDDIAKALDNVFGELQAKGGQSIMSDTTVEIVKDVEGNEEEIAAVEEAVVETEVPETEIVEEAETEVEEVVETPDAEVEVETAEEVIEPVESEKISDADIKALIAEAVREALEGAQLETSKGFEDIKSQFETFNKDLSDIKTKIDETEERHNELKEKLHQFDESVQATQKRLDVYDGQQAISKGLVAPSNHNPEEKKKSSNGYFYSKDFGY